MIVFSAAFYKDILGGASNYHLLLVCSWGLFVISIIFGLIVIGRLTSLLNYASDAKDLEIYDAAGFAAVQLVTFIFAIVLFFVFAVLNMFGAIAISSQSQISMHPTTTVTGAVTANGPITATGPLRAMAPVTATGALTIRGSENPSPYRESHRHRKALSAMA